MKMMTGRDWAKFIHSGDRIFIGSGVACPHQLVDQFLAQVHHFDSLEVVHILTLGETPWADSRYADHLRLNAFFLGRGSREAVTRGEADYTPCFLSEVPRLFTDSVIPISVALIQVSPPDEYGFCSFGVSVDVMPAACKAARYVIAQINSEMPRTSGQSFIHVDEISAFVEASEPLVECPSGELDETTLQIGKYVSLLIEDGCTLQMGIGKIPDAVLHYLKDHNDLGVHTEMFGDGILELFANGNITNQHKGIHAHKTITSFCIGSRKLYDYVDHNPHIEFHPSEYVNQPSVIAQNHKMVAINSAIEVDLTGQVVSDSIGHRFYSGIGGQVDFIRGAGMCPGGRPIIALPATARGGEVSRIVPWVTEGSGVVTSRGDVHYVVTEFGIATLRGRSIRERALELVQVAHPKFREELLRNVQQHFHVPAYQVSKPEPVREFGKIATFDLQLKEQKYYLRALQPSDQRRLQEFFYSHTQKTLFQRYRSQPKAMTTERAFKLVNVDQNRDLALCVVERQGPREIICAVGRYYLEADSRAEVAFVVHETKHKYGMGSVLMEKIIDIARQRKVQHLVAYVRSDNVGMLQLARHFDFQIETTSDQSELIATLELTTQKQDA